MIPVSIKELLAGDESLTILSGSHNHEIRSVTTDTRTLMRDDLFIALKGERFDGAHFVSEAISKGATGVVISPHAVPFDCPDNFLVIQACDTLACLQRIAHLNRKKSKAKCIAITGTNGKTTTKEMLATVLSEDYNLVKSKGNMNNTIGLPLSLLQLTPDTEVIVLEMGTNCVGEIELMSSIAEPDIGIITCVGEAHLEFLGSVEKVALEKAQLLKSLPCRGNAVLNLDDGFFNDFCKTTRAPVVTFGIKEEADFFGSEILHLVNSTVFKLKAGAYECFVCLNTIGLQFVYNALAAVAAASCVGVDYNKIPERLLEFRPVDMRMNCIQLGQGIRVIDDTYNANPDSIRLAIDTLVQVKQSYPGILVLGDMLELGEHAQSAHRKIGRYVSKLQLEHTIFFGKLMEYATEEALQGGIPREKVSMCTSHEEILDCLDKVVKENSVILIKGSRQMRLEQVVRELQAKVKEPKDCECVLM